MIPTALHALLAAFLLLPVALPPGDALAEAESLLAAGSPAEARALLETPLADPETGAAGKGALLEALGRCLRAEGRPWDAEAAFARSLEAAPGLYPALLGRGEVFLELAAGAAAGAAPRGAEVRALAADARRWLEAASRARPEEIRPLRGLARALVLDLDFAGAGKTLEDLAERDSGDAEIRHLLAAARRGAGDRAAAAAAERACLERDPLRADAAALLVADLSAVDRSAEARAAAVEFLLREPGADGVYRALWEVDAGEKRWAPAEEAFLKVLAAHPDHPRALHYLGYVRISAGRIAEALQAFSRKVELEPDNPAPLLQAARLRVARSDLDGAEASFVRAWDLLPADDEGGRTAVLDGLYAVGSAHGAALRYADAERVFRRLTEYEPDSASYRMFLGLSLRRLGRYADAEAACRAAVDRSAFDGNPLNELGLLYLGWGKMKEALSCFTRAADEDPRFTSPLENLGNLARLEGDHPAALDHFLEAHRRSDAFRDEDDRRKFRRYLDLVAREAERVRAAASGGGERGGR